MVAILRRMGQHWGYELGPEGDLMTPYEGKPIKCTGCGTLFGIEQDDGALNIKHRDLYRRIYGTCEGPCRRCGAQIKWMSKVDDQRTG